MVGIVYLKNEIKEYAWGSKTFIPDLIGMPSPSEKPQAEMWLGAHSNTSSIALMDNIAVPLNALINNDPEGVLGVTIANRFSNNLPFLLKILAAAKPLSIQAHPNKEQARIGFAREDLKKIPIESPVRSYKDQNHKPELICALTPFQALKGFRNKRQILSLMERVGARYSGLKTDRLMNQQEEGIKGIIEDLFTIKKEQQSLIIEKILRKVNEIETPEPAFIWMRRLNNEYPGDIGVLSPLFLNIVSLKPSEALYITSGELHAYLEGAGLELMANSDNVIRGGLTSKFVDIWGLMDILEFKPREPVIISPAPIGNYEAVYPASQDEFTLSVISLSEGDQETPIYRGPAKRSAEIIICTAGKALVEDISTHRVLHISKGESIFIPASAGEYTISGTATLYKAATPLGK